MPTKICDCVAHCDEQFQALRRVVQIFQMVIHRAPDAYSSEYQNLYDELRDIAKTSLALPYEDLVEALEAIDREMSQKLSRKQQAEWVPFSVARLIETRYTWMCTEEKAMCVSKKLSLSDDDIDFAVQNHECVESAPASAVAS